MIGHVITDDVKGHLVYHLGDNGVYLTRHDGRTVLFCRQIDLAETGSGAGGHQSEIVGDLGKRHGTGLDSSGYCYEGIQVLGSIDKVKSLYKTIPEISTRLGTIRFR